MIEKVEFRDYLQNKNFVMFFTSIIFMCGVLSCFYGFGIFFASIFTLFLIVFLIFGWFSVRRVLFLILVFYLGFFLTFFKIKNFDELFLIAPVKTSFVGRVVTVPNSVDKVKLKFFIDVEQVQGKKIDARTFVTLSCDNDCSVSGINVGDKVRLKGSLRKPFSATNPSQFDYSRYLRNFNTFTVLYSDLNSVEILSETNVPIKWKVLGMLSDIRENVLNVHSKYLPSPYLEILGGIVFGDDAIPAPENIKNSFVNSGLLHILAASGMNVAFIYSFWFIILGLFRVPYKPRVISGMLLIVIYTLMTGLGPSVVRAALMLLFVLIGKLIDRDTHSVSLLSFVAVLMLIYNPAYINDVSFQMSFLVTLGLLTTANVFSAKLTNIPDWFKAPILIPLVAQIWIAPIQMFYFNTFSLYSILANVSTVCLLSVISFVGFVSSILAVVNPISDFVCKVFDFFMIYLLKLLVAISDFFGNLPYCVIQTTHPSLIQLILYYGLLLIVTSLVKFDKYKKAFVLCVSVISLLLLLGLKPVSKELEIVAFDVQNADSFMIKTPMNKYFFIDTGKAPYKSGNSQAKIIMLKYLKDRGIKNIEGLVVTHFDNDHSGGTVDFIQNMRVKTLYLNSKGSNTMTSKNIFKEVKKTHQSVKIVQNNSVIYSEPNLEIKVFKINSKGRDSDNENSIITLVSYKDFDMLFMGDGGVYTFEKLESNFPHNIEVLKVGHHGGPNVVNEAMLKFLGNDVSLISTGENNFGHPNKGTLDVLRNTEILRTDMLNSIKISTDGKIYKISSYDPHEKIYKFKEKFYAKK